MGMGSRRRGRVLNLLRSHERNCRAVLRMGYRVCRAGGELSAGLYRAMEALSESTPS